MSYALLTLLACGADYTKDKAAAVVEEAHEAEPQAKSEAGKVLKVDPGSSSLRAIGAKVIGSHPIDFKDFVGTIGVDGDTFTSIAFEVQMASLVSDDERLTGHLKNEDFFDVTKFPTSSFQSTRIAKEAGAETYDVTGNLTIHGMTKSVTFPATIERVDGKVKAASQFTLDRQDFGIVYAGKADNLIQDKVAMEIAFVTE